ncbi:MAG TPA: hypothetical protein VN181_02470 [Thermoanaerobaculia bacterium]|nr:hypothetical protein [Thermoanaerobaculia bacterium]
MLEILDLAGPATAPAAAPPKPRRSSQRRGTALDDWLKAQPISVARHAAGLRPFTREEFGDGATAPTEGHLQAANALITKLRDQLLALADNVTAASNDARNDPTTKLLTRFVTMKDRAHEWVQLVEKVWDFYFELFGQRQSRFAEWLLSCDRIALDCYQTAFINVGVAKSIPAPPPFSYMKTGLSPATFRRAIPLQRLGAQLNPFPLIQLPYHRLMNPWTLGAVLHEVSHNLQNDLGIDKTIPKAMYEQLVKNGIPQSVAATWKGWNREIFADMSGLLLGGPAVVASLMDVVGRAPASTLTFMDGAPHPTPWLRTFISCELLRRMGFPAEAADYRRAWLRLYPDPRAGNIPRAMLDTFDDANAIVVDTICYRKYPELGNKSLAEVQRFAPKEQTMVEEAARRLAAGIDPGVVPERFLIGAARVAIDRKLARPGVITTNFYRELARR